METLVVCLCKMSKVLLKVIKNVQKNNKLNKNVPKSKGRVRNRRKRRKIKIKTKEKTNKRNKIRKQIKKLKIKETLKLKSKRKMKKLLFKILHKLISELEKLSNAGNILNLKNFTVKKSILVVKLEKLLQDSNSLLLMKIWKDLLLWWLISNQDLLLNLCPMEWLFVLLMLIIPISK